MLTALLLFLGIVLALNFFTYSILWYETENGPRLERPEQNAASGRAALNLIGRGFLTGFFSLILVVLSYPLGFFKKFRKPRIDSTSSLPPVILVHGLFHNSSAWILYRWWLRRAGFSNLYFLSYNSWTHDFPQILSELEALICEVCRTHPGMPPVLIGHSLGGLLCRAYIEQKQESAEKIHRAVALGAPHQGSTLSVFGLCSLARSLAYRGDLIKELEQKRKPTEIPRLAVYSPADNMVIPRSANLLPYEGWSYHETTPISHLSLLYHRPTAKFVIDFIKANYNAGSARDDENQGRLP